MRIVLNTVAYSGGGSPGTPSGGTTTPAPTPTITVPTTDNGGVAGLNMLAVFPVQLAPKIGTSSPLFGLGLLDPTNFDDTLDGSTYTYRMEDITLDRVPTIRRVILEYMDYGQATIIVTLSGTNDNAAIVSNSVTQIIGNIIPTYNIFTKLIDITLTAFRPQLTISRLAGGGPFAVVSVTMTGEVEEVTL